MPKPGSRKGQGTFYYFNGDRYVGKWKRDKPEGKGIYYYTNGDRYSFFIQCNVTLSIGMRDFLTVESSMAKEFSSMAPWTNMKETSSTAG